MTKTLSAILAISTGLMALADEPHGALLRSSPELQGVSSPAILDFVQTADREISSLHSFMFVRHGQVIAEGWWSPYAAETRHELYSLSKSFTSTAVGLAIAEGKLSLDDEIAKFFTDELPAEPGSNLKAMRVRDLLSMSTGHTSEPKLGMTEPWTKSFLTHAVTHKPGTFFMYNTPATYMLSAIVQKQTNVSTLEYLKPRLFEPLGIQEPTWGTSPQGVSLGGYGLSLRTEDIAKFGQLYLQQGKWEDKQLIPAEWIAAATARQVANGSNPHSDWEQGYGFQFWRGRHGSYRGDGAFGQYCLVMPEQDLVIAITSGLKDMQAVLQLIWDKLLPGLHTQAIAPNTIAEQQLREALGKLIVPTPTGVGPSNFPASVNHKQFVFEPNDQLINSLWLERTSDGNFEFVTKSEGLVQRILCGEKIWIKGSAKIGPYTEQAIAACGAWTAETEYTAKFCLRETPFCLTLRLQFKGDELLVDTESNVGFGPTKRPQLVGHVQK